MNSSKKQSDVSPLVEAIREYRPDDPVEIYEMAIARHQAMRRLFGGKHLLLWGLSPGNDCDCIAIARKHYYETHDKQTAEHVE